VADHELAQVRVEGCAAVARQRGEVGGLGRVRLEELPLDLEQEAEGDAAAERLAGDAEEGQRAGGARAVGVLRGRGRDVVDVVSALGVGELLRGGMVDLGEDDGGEGGSLGAAGGCVLGEDGGVVGDARAAQVSTCGEADLIPRRTIAVASKKMKMTPL
jgi:hypothetical protein